ncbi:helix-turn-helix domain-containing protein [Dactylosporangium sp. NPDC005572]|uniref:TetR/AcrR family transcriptional regulator n=1 Tax=Dactylosporangium sp. NPDC005572 TaxID=3156889 RepID=UPI0033ADF9AC
MALRRDAQRNLERLTAAAVEVFHERGLDAPLEEIARRAGVSPGTLYNRFAGRDALIDAVMPGLIAARLEAARTEALACADAWEGFVGYVVRMCELQASDPALDDAMSRRFPDAAELTALCDAQLDFVREIVARAHAAGALRADFTVEDLPLLMWSTSMVVRATAGVAPQVWRRALALLLDGLRPAAAHPLPVPPLTEPQLHEAMTSLALRSR